MAHGFMGVGLKGWAYVGAFTGFFYYLSRSFKGPEGPKFTLPPALVDAVKETQPAIQPEYYYDKEGKTKML